MRFKGLGPRKAWRARGVRTEASHAARWVGALKGKSTTTSARRSSAMMASAREGDAGTAGNVVDGW
jgi:hypothetical protein